MSRQFEKRDKKIQKMTRDGLVEQNLVTGEETRVSQRGQDFNLRQEQPPNVGSEIGQLTGAGRSRRQPQSAQTGTAQSEPQPEIRRDIPLRPDAARDDTGTIGGKRNKAAYRHEYIKSGPAASPVPDSWQAADARVESGTSTPIQPTDADKPAEQEAEAAGYPERLQFTEGAEHSAPSGVSRSASSRQHGTGYSRRFGQEARASPTDGAKQTSVPKPSTAGTTTEAETGASRLQFNHGENAVASPSPNKKTQRLQKRVDTVTAKLEQAREKLPAKNTVKRKRVYDEQKGKARHSLQFEREPLAPGQKRLAAPAAIGKDGARMAAQGVQQQYHRKIYEVEHENVGIAAAHKAELAAESVARTGGRSVRAAYRFHKNAPYRKVEKLERQAGRLNSKLSFQKAAGANGSAISRAAQKRNIKKRYANTYRVTQKAAKQAGVAAKKAGAGIVKSLRSVVTFAVSHPGITGIVAAIVLVVVCFSTMLSSCMNMAVGGLSSAVIGSYTAPDVDIENAGLSYTEWETDLREQIENAETDHSGYDEYRYDVDMGAINHDPYALMAYLTAKYRDFQYSDIEADLQAVFAEQYSLTFTPEVEIRYNDPHDEDDDGDREPYEWHILNIKLEAKPFADVLAGRMDDVETELFDLYIETRGNRQYLINPFTFDWEPYITCLYGWREHPITGARDFHTGLDIGVPLGTPILAGQDGTVTFSGNNGDYGFMVHIDGENGLSSRYAHCSELLVTAGQEVRKGDVIAKVGSTGASTGPHLHLEVIKDGQRLNPIYFAESI